MTRDGFPTGGRQREGYGCLVTFENAAGKTLVLHRVGPLKKGLGRACDDALALDPTFRVVSYSTPETIETDLSGARMDVLIGARRDSLKANYSKPRPLQLPESAALARIGRKDLLHPRLQHRPMWAVEAHSR